MVESATLQAYAPKVLVVVPCSSTLAQTCAALSTLRQLLGWDDMPAIRQGHMYAVDGQAYFHRPGPGIVDGLEILANLIHPDLFGEFLPQEGQIYRPIAM